MTFMGCIATHTFPAHSDLGVVDESKYDWSEVTGLAGPNEDSCKWSERTDKQWLLTGRCPDPSAYYVEGSDWMARLECSPMTSKHILILGHDFGMEIITDKWSWVSLGVLEGW